MRAHTTRHAPQPGNSLCTCFLPCQVFEYFASQRDGKVFNMTASDMMRRRVLRWHAGRWSCAACAPCAASCTHCSAALQWSGRM